MTVSLFFFLVLLNQISTLKVLIQTNLANKAITLQSFRQEGREQKDEKLVPKELDSGEELL